MNIQLGLFDSLINIDPPCVLHVTFRGLIKGDKKPEVSIPCESIVDRRRIFIGLVGFNTHIVWVRYESKLYQYSRKPLTETRIDHLLWPFFGVAVVLICSLQQLWNGTEAASKSCLMRMDFRLGEGW